jgi:uncharacterized protein (TIGR03435 family)
MIASGQYGAVCAQAPPAVPAFEVASIKAADPDRSMSTDRSGNRLAFSNYSLEMLILWAYNIVAVAPRATESYDAVASGRALQSGRPQRKQRVALLRDGGGQKRPEGFC